MSTLMPLSTDFQVTEMPALLEQDDTITIEPVSETEELELIAEWHHEAAEERAALLRKEAFIEQVRNAMPQFNSADFALAKNGGREEVRNARRVHAFWIELRPSQRIRVCQALACAYLDDGFSDAVARDLKKSLYHKIVLRQNLFNALLLLLTRFDFSTRTLLLQFHQSSQVLQLDVLKARK